MQIVAIRQSLDRFDLAVADGGNTSRARERRPAVDKHGARAALPFAAAELAAREAKILAQDLRRIRGCLLMGGAFPPKSLGGEWHPGTSLEIHVADPDEYVQPAELDHLVYHAPHAHVYRYANKGHLFVDECSRDYDADAADLFEERLEAWLDGLDARVG